MEKPEKEKDNTINSEDIIQIVIGSSVLTVPVAFSEESWRLSETLPFFNVALLLILSLLFVSLYAIQGIYEGRIKHRIAQFLLRVIIDYSVTVVVVFIVLVALNRMPFSDLLLCVKRIILLSFPASMGGVIVDGFDKE